MAGFDASVSYFHGWEDVPDVRLDLGSGQLNAYYPAVDRVGLDLVGAVGDAGLWLEGAVSHQPETDRKYHEVIAGADYTTRQGLYLVGQYYRLSEGHPLALGEVRDYAMVVGRKTVGDSLTVQAGGGYAFKGGATAWLPEATYNLTDGTDLVVGWVGTPKDAADPLLKQAPSQAYAKLKLSL
ncbi:MAG: hypothetical protein NUW23_07565 [Firmicutes bacterium]|jgi:hypothetical protein|nr:hypothetical protein [Bacillota bacterium]